MSEELEARLRRMEKEAEVIFYDILNGTDERYKIKNSAVVYDAENAEQSKTIGG